MGALSQSGRGLPATCAPRLPVLASKQVLIYEKPRDRGDHELPVRVPAGRGGRASARLMAAHERWPFEHPAHRLASSWRPDGGRAAATATRTPSPSSVMETLIAACCPAGVIADPFRRLRQHARGRSANQGPPSLSASSKSKKNGTPKPAPAASTREFWRVSSRDLLPRLALAPQHRRPPRRHPRRHHRRRHPLHPRQDHARCPARRTPRPHHERSVLTLHEQREQTIRDAIRAEAERLYPHATWADLQQVPHPWPRQQLPARVVIPCREHRPAGRHHATAPVYEGEPVVGGYDYDEWVETWNRKYAE